MSSGLEETSRGWGAPIGYAKLTPKQIREAKEETKILEEKYGFKFYD